MTNVRHRFCIPSLLMSFLIASPTSRARPFHNTAELISNIEARSDRQRAQLCGYSVLRTYSLENKHLKETARLEVQLTYKLGQGKKLHVLSMQSTGVVRRSLTNLLDEELRTSAREQEQRDINSRNYEFVLLGEEIVENRRCYKLQLKPRRNSKYLVDGIAWASVNDDAIIRITGQLSKSPSLWLKRPTIDLRFEKIDNFWMPSYNHSTTRVLFVGEVDLTIKYFDYHLQACPAQR